MKALIFIILLALMPTVFKAEPVHTAKTDTTVFDKAQFENSVDETLQPYYKEKGKPKVSDGTKPKRKSRKEQGKTPLLLELGKYAIGLILAAVLSCPK